MKFLKTSLIICVALMVSIYLLSAVVPALLNSGYLDNPQDVIQTLANTNQTIKNSSMRYVTHGLILIVLVAFFFNYSKAISSLVYLGALSEKQGDMLLAEKTRVIRMACILEGAMLFMVFIV